MNTLRQIKSLIIEDNSIDLLLLKNILSKPHLYSFEIDTATSMSEALQLLETSEYDIILSDLNLPDSTGLNTLKTIKTIAPLTPIIVITGELNDEAGLNAVSFGAQDFLTKGHFDRNLLLKSIMYSMERKAVEIERLSSEKSHIQLINALPIGVMTINSNTEITFANPYIFSLFNISPKELLGTI